jgi:hypothetical protein
MQIVECDQGTDEWFRARMGIPTASEFSTVMAQGRGGAESKTRKTYMLKLAGELLTGEPMDKFGNAHTERGKEMEPEARNLYAFMQDCEPQLVGFIRNGQKGCSPDSLIGNGRDAGDQDQAPAPSSGLPVVRQRPARTHCTVPGSAMGC